MKAIILAAGLGTRMGELTKDTPKPLLKLKGKTLLLRNLESLKGPVDEAYIVVGYKKEQIMGYFGDYCCGIKLSYIIQEEQRGTGDALWAVHNHDRNILKSKFILLMADDLYSHEDVSNCLKFDNAILVKKVSDPSRFGVYVVEDGLIRDMVEKPKRFVSDLANCALYVFNSLELKEMHVSSRGEIEFSETVKQIVKERDVHPVEAKGWIPIGTPEDIKKAEELV